MPTEHITSPEGLSHEASHRTGSEFYRTIAEITNDCLWDRDLITDRIFWVDGGHQRVFGYPIQNEYVSLPFWEDRIHPDDKVRVLSKLNKAIDSEDSSYWEDEYRFRKTDGSFAYVYDRARIWYNEDKKPVRIAGATLDISTRVRLQKKLTTEITNRQKKVTAAILEALEKDKTKVGRELYDDVGQILAASKMYLQQAIASDTNREENMGITLQYIIRVMTEIHQLAKSLVIPPPNIIGLFDNIRNLITDPSVVHDIHITFSIHDLNEEQLNEKLQVTIYRIVQEQISNIVKHSGATDASIELTTKDGNIVLLISDNGVGNDQRKSISGLGMTSIKSRAEINNGRVTVWTRPGKGFALIVRLPLTDAT